MAKKEILFEDLKAPINYYPLKIGDAEVQRQSIDQSFVLFHKGVQWCTYYAQSGYELKDQFIEINLAEGEVVTSGLGFGLLQSVLIQKPEIKKLIVYEKNRDVVKLFKKFAARSNVDVSKMEIIIDDIHTAKDLECDWLILDHYEAAHQTRWEILDDVRLISQNNNAKNVWFWPCHIYYSNFCFLKELKFDNKSFKFFSEKLNVKNFPSKLDSRIFEKLLKFREMRQHA